MQREQRLLTPGAGHGDIAPDQRPAQEIVNESFALVADAWSIEQPSPTPGYVPPGRGRGGEHGRRG